MRANTFLLFAMLAGCVHAISEQNANELPPGDDSAGGVPIRCVLDTDCAPAAATCCECPTFAVNRNDPIVRACKGVMCPPADCRDNATAVCSPDGLCKLACTAIACTNTACADGYARDANGCLTCDCEVPGVGGCRIDGECVRTRADCCGCKQGGLDTAVRDVDRASYDDSLGCPATPACPGVDVCTSDKPECVQGRCELLPPGLPGNVCGRFDLPACPPGQACTVNLSDPANMRGLGICAAP